jgi:hypothetical protein
LLHAAALSASTGVTAPDKVDRLEAHTAFQAPEPDAQREAAVAVERGAQRAAVVVEAEPGAPREAEAVAEPDAQPEATAVAVPDARQEAVVVAPDAQLVAAAEPDAQQAVAAAAGAQQRAAAAVGRPAAVAMKSRVRPVAASVEPGETAAVRLWSRPVLFSAPALGPALVSAAKVQAAADR